MNRGVEELNLSAPSTFLLPSDSYDPVTGIRTSQLSAPNTGLFLQDRQQSSPLQSQTEGCAIFSTAPSSGWTPLGRGSDGRFGLRRFRAKLTPAPVWHSPRF